MINRVMLAVAGVITMALPLAASDVKIWPLFYHAADPVTDVNRTELLWPLYVRERSPEYTAHQLLSFPQRYPSGYPHQFYLGWPLSGLRIGPDGHDAWLFPFLWSGEDYFTLFPLVWYGRHYCSLFPLFYYGHSGTDDHPRRTLNLALFQHNSWSDQGRTHTLWPLVWYRQYQGEWSKNRSIGVFPLFWNSQSASSNSTSRSASRSGHTLLLQGWRRHAVESSEGRVSSSTNSANWLFPLYYRSRDQHQTLSNGKTELNAKASTQVALSLRKSSSCSMVADDGKVTVISAESQRSVLPFWWAWDKQYHDTQSGGRMLFPFWWRSRLTLQGTLEQSASFLVPIGAHLYKKGVYETRNILGPILNRTENKVHDYVRYDGLFPFFSLTLGSSRSGGRFFPLAGTERELGKYSNFWYLFPLGWSCESQARPPYRAPSAQFWALHELERRPFVAAADCPDLGASRLTALYPLMWSRRTADVQSSAFLPFWYQRTSRQGATVSRDVTIPLLLGVHGTSRRDGVPVYSRHDYLLSLLAWGSGEDYRLHRLFPLWSYTRYGEHRDLAMLVPPFSRSAWNDPQRPGQHRSSEIAVPFSFLPWFYSRQYQDGTGTQSRSSWFFPFYKRTVEQSTERDVRKLSILWPLWNGEWERGETRIRGLGGTVNYFERDVNRFVEQRILYRLFTRRTRSWFTERELMPFYSSQTREDGNSYWKILGGLAGREVRDGRTYLRLLYLPIPTGAARPSNSGSSAEQQAVHADLALNYLQHGRYDRAAIEFTLAGNVRDDDLAFQMAAASAYLDADPESIGKELRSTVPSSLEPMTGKGRRDRQTLHTNLRQMAVRRFEAAIGLGGDAPELLRQMAVAYDDMGQQETALEKLAEAVRLRPSFALGMERLALLRMLGWDRRTDRFEPAGVRQEPLPSDVLAWRRQWIALLAELRRAYPGSPALCRIEAEGPASESDDAYGGWSPYHHAFMTGDPFSADMQRRLALFERGALLEADAEERTWIAGDAAGRHRRRGVASTARWHRWMGDDDAGAPARACATQAISLLNRQAESALDRKEYATVDPLSKRILELLPHACVLCDPTRNGSATATRMGAGGPVADSMQRLYRYYVTVLDDPVGYIALAENWIAGLCPHQQVAIEQSLKPLRLELQYLKNWQITGLGKTQVYRGAFYDRYVDLDTILGHPDRCTVTAECDIVTPAARDAVLRLGFDHRLKAELNGKEIFREKKRKIAVRDEFTVPVALLAGENLLRLSITDDKLAFGFFARLSDKDGLTMKDVEIRVPGHE